jgi:hypothetical protein
MKFVKVEDRISGTLLSVADAPAEDQFPPQKVYELEVKTSDKVVIDNQEQESGVWYVGISVNKLYVNNAMKRAKIGQKIGFKFTKEIEATKKGFSPAKSITPYIGKMDPDYKEADNMPADMEVPPFDNSEKPV